MDVIKKFHFGVYGIVLKQESILLIKKNRGPYTGKFDLPGGKPEYGETPTETLIREVMEESGVKVQTMSIFDNYGTIACEIFQNSIKENTHHVGMIYLVSSYNESGLIHAMEHEDSSGALWSPIHTLTEDVLSPFAFHAIADIKHKGLIMKKNISSQ